MKLCKQGHPIGTDADCKCCKASRVNKQRWASNYQQLKEMSQKNMKGLNSADAQRKRAEYFASELHKQRASKSSRKMAAERRAGLRPLIPISKKDTKPELATRQVLEELKVDFIPQFAVGPYHFDFGLPAHKVLIEIQGEYWHSLQNNIANDLAKEAYVKSQHPDFRIVYISELEALKRGAVEKIICAELNVKIEMIEIDLGSLTVAPIASEIATDFIAKRHYLPRFRKSTRYVHGIFHAGELLGILLYASPSYHTIAGRHKIMPRHVVELSRMVVRNDCHVKNLISKAMSLSIRLLKKEDLTLVVSYADPHFGHDGSVYLACNWVKDGQTPASYYYADQAGNILHKKTIWDHSSKMGIKEADYAEKKGLRRVDTAPKNRFLYWFRRPTETTSKNVLEHQVVCDHCQTSALISESAHYRAMRKHKHYVCLSCSIANNWKSGSYKNRPKRVSSNKKEPVGVKCACGITKNIQQKTLDGVIRKHGEYKCMGCIIRSVHKAGNYDTLKRASGIDT